MGRRPTRRVFGTLLALAVLVTGAPPPALAQTTDHGEAAAAGPEYRAGPLHRWILGRHYRDLWTQVIQVELLDLASFAGGLEPLRVGGGRQTRSLRFLGADGREYSFRSVDKDPSQVLDSILRGTVIDDLVQDGISAAHPYGALVAAPLLEAAGILHVAPQLFLMPDDPALGPFRGDFAGVLGLIEERPDENEGDRAAFQGTLRVISSERFTERLQAGPADQVDARAFLAARLMDVFLGDWDRHRGQWRWAVYSDDEPRMWIPVPSDRDQAFSKFDGVATRIVSWYMPQFVRFEDDYPDISRLHWNARALDRWLLSGLERETWDSVGAELQARLTDEVIEAAVAQLPPEIGALNGAELARSLRARRDRLPEAWGEFYRLLANRVDIYATDADEMVEVRRSRPSRVEVTMRTPGADGPPRFRRSFAAGETDEIRVYLQGGNDRVVFDGDGEGPIQVRVVGGPGDDRYEFRSGGDRVYLYDSGGDNVVSGAAAPPIDDRPFSEWVWTEEDRDQPRDWGSRIVPTLWSSYSSDLGVFIGGGARAERYGFRQRPYASAFDVRGGFAPAVGKGRLEIDVRANRANSNVFLALAARVSRLDVIHYYGLGNATSSGGKEFHEVDQTATSLGLRLGADAQPGPAFELSGGVSVDRISTASNQGRFYETLGPIYGGGEFVQLAGTLRLVWDPLVESERTANRVRLTVDGSAFPGLFDVERAFARYRAGGSLLLASSPSPPASLLLTVSAEQVWGRFPWHEAAFLGGVSTLRAFDEQRFAGDASAFGNAELRLRLWRPRVVVPASLGVFGFGEAGRVWLNDSSPGGWHTGVGGGLWLQPIRPEYLLRAGVATSDDATKGFIALSLPY